MNDEIATITVMRDEFARIPPLLEDLSWAAERHIVVTGPELPSQLLDRVTLHHAPRRLGASFDEARAEALSSVRARWVLVVDTDERVPSSLVDRLTARIQDPGADALDGIWIPRRNHILGRPLRYSSVWPDYQLRFLRTDSAAFSSRIHNPVASDHKRVEWLPAADELAIQHFSFESTREFVAKLNLYTDIEAAQTEGTGRTGVARAAILGTRDFLTRYVRMQGFRDGSEGLHLSILMGFSRYLLESKRWEREHRKSDSDSPPPASET